MINHIAYFEIQSSNPGRDVAFYEAVFQWKFVKEEQLPITYFRIETAGMAGGLLQRPAAVPPPGSGTNGYVCSMQVDNFDKTSELILKNGGQVALPKFAVPGTCWQGYFMDPDQNVFGIFQPDPAAI